MGRDQGGRRRGAWTAFAVLAAAIVIADQLLKHWIVANYAVDTPVQVVGDWVRIEFIHNAGGLFGLFQNAAPLFALVSVGVIGMIVALELRWGWRSWLITAALGLLLGGAIGNLVDRITLRYVVDFVDIGIGTWRWWIFNLADSAVSVSIAVLLLISLFRPKLLPDQPEREAGDADEPRGPVAG